MTLQAFIGWITEAQYLHVMSLADGQLRAYVETAALDEMQELLRGIFAHRISNDFIKYDSGRYYFTIRF